MKKGLISIYMIVLLLNLVGCTNFLPVEKRGNDSVITQEQKDLLITYDDLSFFDIEEYNVSGCESFVSKTNMDGSIELEYKFNSGKNKENEALACLYFNSEIEINSNFETASKAFHNRIKAYKIGAKIADIKIIEIEDVPDYYDNLYVALREYKDNYIGNIIVTQTDNKIVAIITDGLYMDDHDLIIEFLDTFMADIAAYD